MIISTTETTFASRAPRASDTTLDIECIVIGSTMICVYQIHAMAAAISWIVATRLVARWIAPIWVRSPNLRMVAMMLTTTAAYNSMTAPAGTLLVAHGDFDGNKKSDVAWAHPTNGSVWLSLSNGSAFATSQLAYSYTSNTGDPMDIEATEPALFFQRLAAHLCAPTFVFLTGLGAWLYANPASGAPRSASGFLIKRGLLLIFLEVTVINLAWYGDVPPKTLWLQVIWAIGISMVVLGLVSNLPRMLLAVVAPVARAIAMWWGSTPSTWR